MENLKKEIEQLKQEKNAVLLAHYYVDDAVQEIADYVGDSYYLAKVALKESKDVICFAGVNFMGESAKILNPEKTVLMPDMAADCPMAHMASPETIEKVRAEYDDLAVVCYINSTAELKKYSDVCVTSSNAVKIVKNLPNKNIFFSFFILLRLKIICMHFCFLLHVFLFLIFLSSSTVFPLMSIIFSFTYYLNLFC